MSPFYRRSVLLLLALFGALLLLVGCAVAQRPPVVDQTVMETQRIALSYGNDRDIVSARAQIEALDVPSPMHWLLNVTERAVEDGDDPATVAALLQLTEALGLRSASAAELPPVNDPQGDDVPDPVERAIVATPNANTGLGHNLLPTEEANEWQKVAARQQPTPLPAIILEPTPTVAELNPARGRKENSPSTIQTILTEVQSTALENTAVTGMDNGHVPDRIVIQSIDLDTPVVDLGWSKSTAPSGRVFNNWDVAAYAAGWHVNSDKLGYGGNVVLSGHNNILGAVFRELDQLKAGDVATIWSDDRRYDYEIDKVLIVPELNATHEQRLENARWIGEFGDDRLTLVTCWPRDGNSHRIIAIGRAVDSDETR